MKRRIKGIAAMLVCLAILAAETPARAIRQENASAEVPPRIFNGTSYVYPMDCGLVYDIECTLITGNVS